MAEGKDQGRVEVSMKVARTPLGNDTTATPRERSVAETVKVPPPDTEANFSIPSGAKTVKNDFYRFLPHLVLKGGDKNENWLRRDSP